jgi:hypothetical protein
MIMPPAPLAGSSSLMKPRSVINEAGSCKGISGISRESG